MNGSPVTSYSEASQQDQPRNLQLAHLSIEVGHFYMEDLLDGEDRIRAQFTRVAPWVHAAKANAAIDVGMAKPRVSTCFLMDDYFRCDTDPGPTVRKLASIAAECGITIDYLAREDGCHVADGVPLADFTKAMLLPEPPVGTNGSRPPAHESGWLCNGERAPDSDSDQAMQIHSWTPPVQFGKRNHSIFLDIELWKDVVEKVDGKRISRRLWSCPFLAAVWHLLRLGILRDNGEAVAVPQPWPLDAEWPESWHDLPAVLQLNPRAAPFSAFRSVSILPRSYLPVEHAIDVILAHLDYDEAVLEQLSARARQESITLPKEVTDRISHVFIDVDLPAKDGSPDAGPR